MNISNITVLKDFIPRSDFKKIFKDVKLNFNKNIHKDDLKSGKQTKPNLHLMKFQKLRSKEYKRRMHKWL